MLRFSDLMLLIYNFLSILTLAGYDYKTTIRDLVFEPFNGQQQCLNIKIVDDSLPEDLEVFTLLLSTDNSEVNLITDRVDVHIQPNDKGKCYTR